MQQRSIKIPKKSMHESNCKSRGGITIIIERTHVPRKLQRLSYLFIAPWVLHVCPIKYTHERSDFRPSIPDECLSIYALQAVLK